MAEQDLDSTRSQPIRGRRPEYPLQPGEPQIPTAQQASALSNDQPHFLDPVAIRRPACRQEGRFGRSQRASSSGEPVYKNRIVQLAVLVLLLALLAAMVL